MYYSDEDRSISTFSHLYGNQKAERYSRYNSVYGNAEEDKHSSGPITGNQVDQESSTTQSKSIPLEQQNTKQFSRYSATYKSSSVDDDDILNEDIAEDIQIEQIIDAKKTEANEEAPEGRSRTTRKKQSANIDSEEERSASVAKNTALMSLATLGSRATGLLRTWVMAFALGNTMITSAYQVANNMPNVLFDLIAGGLIGAAFIPVYMLEKERKGEKAANGFGNNILCLTTVVLGIITILATIFAPQVIATQTFTVGETAQVSETAVIFFRIFAAQILFYGISGIINGILNAYRVYFIPALAPALNNVIVIVSFLIYIPLSTQNQAIALLVLGVGGTLGVAVQAIIQIPALLKLGFKFKFFISLNDAALIEALKIAVPTMIYIVGTLVAFTYRNAFSLDTGDNGPATLLYAWTWFQLPYGVIAVSLSRTMFTEMSEANARCDRFLLRKLVEKGLSSTFFLIIPLASLMFLFSTNIMQLFQAGKFSAEDVQLTAQVLMCWTLSLPFYSAWMFLYNVFASIRKFGIFAFISCIMVIPQCLLYGIFSNLYGLIGITFADLAYYSICCIIAMLILKMKIGGYGMARVLGKATIIAGSCIMGCGCIALIMTLLPPLPSNMLVGFLTLIIGGSLGLFICYLICWFFGIPEFAVLKGILYKFKRAK